MSGEPRRLVSRERKGGAYRCTPSWLGDRRADAQRCAPTMRGGSQKRALAARRRPVINESASRKNRCTAGDLDFDAARNLPGYEVARAKRYGRIRLCLFAAGVATSLVRTAAFAMSAASATLQARTAK